jgi:hypothetical protein
VTRRLPTLTTAELLAVMLLERFGVTSEAVRERPPTPLEMTKRRLVLIGRDTEEERTGSDAERR